MKFSILKEITWLLMGLVFLLVAACGGGSSDSPSGTLQLALTDAVDPNLKEVIISIKEIRAVPNGREAEEDNALPLIKSFETSLVVNVLNLAYQQELLGEALVPAGTYNQIRLILDKNSAPGAPVNYITFQDDSSVSLDPEEIALTTPSAHTSGLKILGKFTVAPGELTSIVLDLDPSKAVHQAGANKWILKPTGIRITEVEDILAQYGAITGQVLSGVSPVSNAAVLVIPAGGEVPAAAGMVHPEDGSFRALLREGSYVISVEAEGFETFSSEPVTYDVIVGEDTLAGDIGMTAL